MGLLFWLATGNAVVTVFLAPFKNVLVDHGEKAMVFELYEIGAPF